MSLEWFRLMGPSFYDNIEQSSTFTWSTTYTDYKCPTCKKRYRRPSISYSCTVDHMGGCCHHNEIRINKKGEPK